jgi:hypothetical protein
VWLLLSRRQIQPEPPDHIFRQAGIANMANETQDLVERMRQLMARSMEEQFRASQRYYEVMQRAGRGELLTKLGGEEYWRFVQEEGPRYARNLVTLSLDYYNALIEMGRSYNDLFYDQALRVRDVAAPASPSPTGPESRPPRRVEIGMRGAVGSEATASFSLENKRNEPLEISFFVSDFISPTDTASFRPPLQIHPLRFTMAPGEERTVTLRLPLTADCFAPGQRYTATILARGYDHLELGVNLLVDEAPEDAPPLKSAREKNAATGSSRDRRKTGR